MELWQLLLYVLMPILVAYVGYNERDKSMMKQKLDQTHSKSETEHLIELKNKPIEVLQQEACKDIQRCNDKLDKIEDMLRSMNGRTTK